MYKNIKVEAEHNELILENSHGDKVIIPANKRNWVKQKLSEGCHNCIDSLVETLPVASQYAGNGSVYPPNTKIKVNQNNQIKEYDISSLEYRDLYNTGRLVSYDKTTDTYSATPLKEVTIAAEAPQWLKYKRDYEKTNPKSNYINSYLTPFAKALGNTETNYPKRLDDEYEQKALDYVSEQLVKNKPQGELSRAEWLNQMSDKEEELIKRNPKYQSSLWADTKRGLTSLVEQDPLHTFQNILTSSDYTNREKQEMLKDYADHPVMSKLGDAAKILNPLTVPSKMVQSAYKDDYSFTDALKGKKNNAGIVEDIATDPLNLVGLGIWGKLSKANKFKTLDEVYNSVKGLSKEEALKELTKVEKPFQNRIFESNIQLGSPKPTSHISDINYTYRTLGQSEIDDILKTGTVNPKPGKQKGGNINVKYWTKGNGKNWYDGNTIRVKNDKIKIDEKVKLEDLEYLNPSTNQFEPLASLVNNVGSKVLNKTDDVVKNLPKVENLDKVSEKVITENVVKAGFPNPLTLLTKPKTLIDNILGRNQLEKNASNLYRKIGNKKGLKSLIENEGAISPGYDNVWFAKGSPNEDYNGVFAVELSSDKIGIGKNEISKGKGLRTGYKITNKNNIPLEDLKVYRRRFLSTAYKEIDKTKLANELKTANIQNYIESLWKYGSQGYLLHEFLAHEFPKDFDKWTPKVEKFYKEKIKPASKSIDEYMWNLITKSK